MKIFVQILLFGLLEKFDMFVGWRITFHVCFLFMAERQSIMKGSEGERESELNVLVYSFHYES